MCLFQKNMYICNENNNDKNMISSIPQVTDITPLDALWALYQSQSKRVRKAFLKRIEAQDNAEKYEAQMRALESKLSSDERKKLHQMAYEINARAQEVKHAQKQGKCIGRSADDFLAELQKEQL